MLAHLLIAIYGIAAVLGQASYGSESFKYWGCATVDAAGFTKPVQLPNGVLSPESCQTACAGHMFAAVSPDACRCGDDPNAIKAIDEHSCNYPCSEDDPNSPMCGGICPKGTPSISNLFIIEPVSIQNHGSVPEPGSSGNQPVPSDDVFPPLEVSAASDALPQETSLPPAPPSLPESQGVQVPPLSTDAIQPPPEISAPLPLSSPTLVDPPTDSPGEPGQTSPESTINFSSSLTLTQGDPPATPAVIPPISTWGAPGIPPESPAGPTGSETLLTETAPVPIPSTTPSRVVVSESNQFEISVFFTLGKLFIIAAMVF
ncbi:hypothetical protein NW762_002950 [Fusarium torreyae]|uniref:WSC domain-containing protein n=1 Tax=Fusarium torreyae TaxID=1237075 RepID=A0A9W8VN41_9HYPO|nr:hypothetical protein NW762_002950 [Fusarium torreyae]